MGSFRKVAAAAVGAAVLAAVVVAAMPELHLSVQLLQMSSQIQSPQKNLKVHTLFFKIYSSNV